MVWGGEVIRAVGPGKVEINKIAKGFPYLVTTGLSPPPLNIEPQDQVLAGVDCCIAALLPSKTTMKWARRIECWRVRRANTATEGALLDSGATSSFVQSAQDVQLTGKSDKLV